MAQHSLFPRPPAFRFTTGLHRPLRATVQREGTFLPRTLPAGRLRPAVPLATPYPRGDGGTLDRIGLVSCPDPRECTQSAKVAC